MIFPKMLLIVVVKEKMMSFGDESRYQPWLSTCHADTWTGVSKLGIRLQ